jgi:hypothetical protein
MDLRIYTRAQLEIVETLASDERTHGTLLVDDYL